MVETGPDTMQNPDPKLVQQMLLAGNGADVHTRNKARCYYVGLRTTPAVRYMLDTAIRQALASGDWSKLRCKMARWF